MYHSSLLLIYVALTIVVLNHSYAQTLKETDNMVLEDIPDIPEEVKSRIQQYQHTRSAHFADWIPNEEGILIATRFGNTDQFHRVTQPGGARSQITFYDEPVGDIYYGPGSASFCPSSDYSGFLFTKDVGGDEFFQLYWHDTNSRKAEMISDGKSVNFNPVWSNQGDQFAFTSTRRNHRDFDIYLSNIETPKQASLMIDRGQGYWIVRDWSPDDRQLLIVQIVSRVHINSYVLDVATNKLEPINNPAQEAIFEAYAWDETGTKIYAASDEGRDFRTLVVHDLAQGTSRFISDDIPWDIEAFTTNADRTKAAFIANNDGFSQLYSLDTETNHYQQVPNLPVGQISSIKFHSDRDELAMDLSSSQTPGDVYSLDLGTGRIKRWTTSEVGGLDTRTFPKPELIQYHTFDEVDGKPRRIPAFVYKPTNYEGKLPVLISIHGGPEYQYKPEFSSFHAYLTNELGIAVIAPNVRGSSGYGKTFINLDNGFNRDKAVKDIGKLLDWISDNPDFDSRRIAVYGGSYGGYMVLSSMFNYPEKIACGISYVGTSNLVTFLENTEEYRRDWRRLEYGDEREPAMREYLESIAPLNHASQITSPLLVIQGANDPRVPASESEQIVEAVRENGQPVWYMLAKDEGHGFRKKKNRDQMTEVMALFLQRNLMKETTTVNTAND